MKKNITLNIRNVKKKNLNRQLKENINNIINKIGSFVRSLSTTESQIQCQKIMQMGQNSQQETQKGTF